MRISYFDQHHAGRSTDTDMNTKFGPAKSLPSISEAGVTRIETTPGPIRRQKPAPLPQFGADGSNVPDKTSHHSGHGQTPGSPPSPFPGTQYSPKPVGHDKSKRKKGKVKEAVGVYENWTAILDYQSTKTNELTLRKGEPVQVLSKQEGGWWLGQVDNRLGVFPSIYVAQKSSKSSGKFSIRPLEIDKSELTECEVIGVGGFGRVYRGVWRREEHEVALKKVIREPGETRESASDRVRREGKLLCLLHHPNIIRLRGICLQEPSMCLVMEYARGGSLFRVLRGQKLTLDVIVNWAIQVAKGMRYLHEEVQQSFRLTPIIHRDLKSHNILVYESMDDDDLLTKTLKITDFGQARQVTQTARMSNAGTYAWAAPESIRERRFSKYSDVWSYGVVLWEMLTGEVPYNGYEPLQILYAVGSFRRLPIPEKCPKVFQTLLKACWEEVPEQRPLFSKVLSTLENIKVSPLVTQNMASFKSLQVQWHQEIQEKLEKLRARDDELNERADAINQLLQKQQAQEESLNRREQEFFLRELELFEREITVMIREQNFDQMQNALTKKKRWISVPNLFKKLEISKPKDVVHVTEVTKVTTPDNPHPRFKIMRTSPGTPHSEVSSPTDASSRSPRSPSGAQSGDLPPKAKEKKRFKSPISRLLDKGKTKWYTTVEKENERPSRDVAAAAVASPGVTESDEHAGFNLHHHHYHHHQGSAVELSQPCLPNAAAAPRADDTAAAAAASLVISRKPTIDYDPRKFEATLFQSSSSTTNRPTGQETHARRPSTLELTSIAAAAASSSASSGSVIMRRNPSQSIYQWGTLSYVIDTAPDKTTIKIGGTPTSATHNSANLNPFNFQNSSVSPPLANVPSNSIALDSAAAAAAAAAVAARSSQRVDARLPTNKPSLTNFAYNQSLTETGRSLQQYNGIQPQQFVYQ